MQYSRILCRASWCIANLDKLWHKVTKPEGKGEDRESANMFFFFLSSHFLLAFYFAPHYIKKNETLTFIFSFNNQPIAKLMAIIFKEHFISLMEAVTLNYLKR